MPKAAPEEEEKEGADVIILEDKYKIKKKIS